MQLLLECGTGQAISASMTKHRGSQRSRAQAPTSGGSVTLVDPSARPRRTPSFVLAGGLVVSLLAPGCAGASGNTPSPTYVPPPQCVAGVPAPGVPDGEKTEATLKQEEPVSSLPRYFTVELSAGVTFANGVRVTDAELLRVVSGEAKDTRNQGAAVVVGTRVDGSRLLQVFGRLSDAGFSHIVFSGVPEGVVLAALGSEEASLPVATPPAGEAEPEPEPEPAVADDDPSLEVKTIGLHVGGGPNDTQTRQRYVGIIEGKLSEFKKCHVLTLDTNKKASFGVDLLVSKKGGRPTVKDYRTSLKGRDFQACVLGTFGQIRFPEMPRPTVISYSFIFKPNAR